MVVRIIIRYIYLFVQFLLVIFAGADPVKLNGSGPGIEDPVITPISSCLYGAWSAEE